MAGLAPRRTALDVLTDVLDKRRALTDVLDRRLAPSPNMALSPRDQGLVRALCYTTLRHLGRIDAVLGDWMQKPLPEGAGPTLHILRLAFAEIGYLRTPAYAAGATAMGLAGADTKAKHFRNVVNALVRRAGNELDSALQELPNDAALPPWLVRGWAEHYGQDKSQAILNALTSEAPLDVTLHKAEDIDEWTKTLEAERLPTGSLRLPSGTAVETLPGYADGRWWIQDAAAALPARLLNPQPGEHIADLCAAPGGKTLQLCAAGANVVAVDQSKDRLKLLEKNLRRTKLSAQCVTANALDWEPSETFDAILLDAPCSATGTIRRHPDLPWIKDASDIRALSELQRSLIIHAGKLLKPGGRLIYSVCSLEAAEGEDLLAAMLEVEPEFANDPFKASELEGIEPFLIDDGWLRTNPADWTEFGGIDGFFAARLIKQSTTA